MKFLEGFSKVNDNVTVYRYHNGWMVEISGRDKEDEWPTRKIICQDLKEVNQLFIEYAGLPLND